MHAPAVIEFESMRCAEPGVAITRSRIFDLYRYRRSASLPESTDLAAAIEHYLVGGEREGLAPHALFLPEFVRAQYDALGMALVADSVLLTYLAYPEAPVDPHPVFDHRYFVRQDATVSPLSDYLQRVYNRAAPPSPHVLFDPVFYYRRYPDVAAAKADAFLHYIGSGWMEDRQPHPLFDQRYWSRALAALGIAQQAENPLLVYCTDSSTWRAATHPLFDPAHFIESLQAGGLTPSDKYPPLADSLTREPELTGTPLFDAGFYRTQGRRRGIEVTRSAPIVLRGLLRQPPRVERGIGSHGPRAFRPQRSGRGP